MAMFDDLKKGLSEVDAFLNGKQSGYKVTVPEEIDTAGPRCALSCLPNRAPFQRSGWNWDQSLWRALHQTGNLSM